MMATTKPKALTAAQIKERNERAYGFAVAIAGSTIIFEVLDRTDGKFTTQVGRVAFELADDFMRRAAQGGAV
jgi:hypothetical protein